MRKKVLSFLLIFSLMLVIPLLFANNKVFANLKLKQYTEKEIVVGMVCADYKKEYTEETLKALTIIRYSNYKYNNGKDYKKNNGFMTEKSFIKKFGKNHLERVKKAVDSTYKKVITYNKKVAKIPYFYCSSGHINKSKKYPYINECACPWDSVNKKRSDKTVGISLNTVNYLTKQGSDCKEALCYFLNNVEIAKTEG
ncbi:MAG: SpoIID/LytB domain-containing protein [Ruminococcus sp.]